MKGKYIPFNDGFGIVGYGYLCPKCEHETKFTDCEEGCEKCGFSEEYVDPDDWYEKQIKPKQR
jgi:hypothetical protein